MEPMEPPLDPPLVGAGSGGGEERWGGVGWGWGEERWGGVGWGDEVAHQEDNTVLQDLYSIGVVRSFII